MTPRLRMLIRLAAGLACAPASGWAQVGLKHDPFTRPSYTKAAPPGAVQAGTAAGKETVPELPWEPDLAAVLVAGSKSAVSIDGTLVRIGEVVQGHRLVEVHEREAVFVKNRKRVTVALRPLVVPGAPAGKTERAPAGRPEPVRTQDALREREEK